MRAGAASSSDELESSVLLLSVPELSERGGQNASEREREREGGTEGGNERAREREREREREGEGERERERRASEREKVRFSTRCLSAGLRGSLVICYTLVGN